MYDYFLNGKDNYEVDRRAGDEVIKLFPTVKLSATTNREFMHRAVRYLAREEGVRQFLDIGTGIPTEPNLHQVAQEVAPEARVVYVDNDPVVLAHARALLRSAPEGRTAYIPADATAPDAILAAPELSATLDLEQPVALGLCALLHFVPDDRNPQGIIDTLLNALVPGSFLVLSQTTPDFLSAETVAAVTEVYRNRGIPSQARTRDEFARFFTGLELVEPGVVVPHRWHASVDYPPDFDAAVSMYAGVARK